jgi:predicted dehydrogenase
MPTRLAILGLDTVQRSWLTAVDSLRNSGAIELVAVAHRSLASAKDIADLFTPRPPAFDDLRLFLKDAAPQVILMDRPSNVSVDFIAACLNQDIAILSLGPPVENVAEAQALAEVLEPRTHLLYVWPRLTDTFSFRHFLHAQELIQPIRFASATWLGMNHALAKTASNLNPDDIPVRSLSVLAWDALATLIDLFGIPSSVYASVRGTVGSGDAFNDISGACALTLRFAPPHLQNPGGEGVASVTLSDRVAAPANQRSLLLLGQGGSIHLQPDTFECRDNDGKLLDAGRAGESAPPRTPDAAATGTTAREALHEFLHHFTQPASPARGWNHRLPEIAATMEALIVSHRTGQAESPERFHALRR